MSQVSSYYNVQDDGELVETPVSGLLKDILTPEMVVLVVEDIAKKIWLWKGSNAKVRKKFIAARKSQDLRGEKGLTYKVESIDHGDEPQEFINLIGGPVAASSPEVIEELSSFVPAGAPPASPTPPAQPAQPKPSFQPAYSPPPDSIPAPVQPIQPVQPFQPAEPANIVEIPAPAKPSIPPPVPPPAQQVAPQPVEPTSDVNASIQALDVEDSVKQILARIQSLKVPTAFERELICIGPYVFSQIESKKSFLGKETVEHRFELMTSLPEGEFLASNYVPRLLINEGRVMGIELLKTGEDITPGTQLEAFKIRFQK